MALFFCLFLPSFDKKIAHYSFCINKMKNKKTTSHVAVFGRACATRNILAFFCVCLTLWKNLKLSLQYQKINLVF